MAFTPLIQNERGKKIEDSNIFIIAIIAGLINLTLLVSLGAYQVSLDWQGNLDDVRNDVSSILGTEVSSFQNGVPSTGLCKPNEQDCSTSWLSGAFNPLIFDVFASVITIGDGYRS